MPILWRLLLSIYNILMILVAGAFLAASLSIIDLQPYLETTLTDQNRLLTAVIALSIIFLALVFRFRSGKHRQ
jgi:MFS-type transporter involved in bile tolerance (Atg22 family)